MSALPDVRADFRALEAALDAEPADSTAQIVAGIWCMSPRGRVRHGAAVLALGGDLRAGLAAGEGGNPPDWLFVADPELRSERAFSRLVPDIAGWRRSTTGWPAPEAALIELVPEWVAEVLSPATETLDRRGKMDAYGMIGVAWVWLLDPEHRTVEVFENVRARMVPRHRIESGSLMAPPFEPLALSLDRLFL